MSKSLRSRFSGFILIDVLVALSVLSISIAIYWPSFSAQSEFNESIRQYYSLRRLEADARILIDIDQLQRLYVAGYRSVSDVSFDSRSITVNLINPIRVVRFVE